MKNLILCADDYGQNKSISNGILNLIDNNILSATSCMTNLSHWQQYSAPLRTRDFIDRGVHINFTYGKPLDNTLKTKIGIWPESPLRLMYLIMSGKITKQDLKNEIHQQLLAFENELSIIPDFIDGHQHLHHFPIIASSFMETYLHKYKKLNLNQKPYVRVSLCRSKLGEEFWLKKKAIQYSGSKRLLKILIKYHIPHNKHFTGIYSFSPQADPAQHIKLALKTKLQNNTLFMCHPALQSTDPLDPIKECRYKEYQFFMSKEFKELCTHYSITTGRFQRA